MMLVPPFVPDEGVTIMGDSKKGGCLGPLAILAIVFFGWWIIAAHFSDTRATRTGEVAGYTEVTVDSSTIWFTEFKGCGSLTTMKMWRVSGTDAHGVRRHFLVCGQMWSGNFIAVK
jgi:hypothetical protein